MDQAVSQVKTPTKPVPNAKAILQRDLLARYMLLSGFITYIIQIETGLTAKRVRLIHNALLAEGFPDTKRSRSSRSSKTLLSSRKNKIAASLAMALYYRFGKEQVMETINIHALTKAYGMYVSILQEAPFDKNLSFHEPCFSISDLWNFAKELRSGESVIFNCKSCNCDYYSAVEEPTLIDCPFCDTAI